MDEKSLNPQGIKKYTAELRVLLEAENILTTGIITTLQEKYKLSPEDILIVESLATSFYKSAKSDFEFGNWDKALTHIEEALYKSPINLDNLELYFLIVTDSRKLLGDESKDQTNLDLILKRIQRIDKKIYHKLSKQIKTERKSFNKLWYLTILLLIPLFFMFKSINTKKNIVPNKVFSPQLKPGEILVDTKILRHPAQLVIDIVESKLESTLDSYIYNLKFYLSSEKKNITSVKGNIIWYDISGIKIYSEKFESPKRTEYYINEMIPITFKKSSHRDSPSIDKIIIEITAIESTKGIERGDLQKIETIFPVGKQWDLIIEEEKYLMTEGVTKNYLTLNLIVKSSDIRDITTLNGRIEWVDTYDIVVSSSNINFINKDDIPLDNKYYKIIYKTFEIGQITPNYRIKISEIK